MMLTVFVAYLLVVMVVGVVSARYGRSPEDYFLADRKLGAWVTAISATASSESGWLVIGLVGEAYIYGAKAVWTAHGVLLGFVTNWYFVAPRLRAQSRRLDAVTITDFLAARFRDQGNVIRFVGVAVVVAALMGYVAAQFTATGKAFQGAFGIPYQAGVLIGAAITILYTMVGGFRAVAWTDLVQGLLMVFGLVVLPLVTLADVGSGRDLFRRLADTPPRVEGVFEVTRGSTLEVIGVEETPVTLPGEGLILVRQDHDDGGHDFMVQGPAFILDGRALAGSAQIEVGSELRAAETTITFTKVIEMVGDDALADPFGGEVGLAMLGWVIGLFGIGLGYPGQPQVVTRFMAASSKETIRRGQVIAIVWGILALYGAILLGHAARLALPELVDPEQAYPVLAAELLPPVVAGLVLAAIVSAMMSTADSQLLVVASAVSRDVVEKGYSVRAGTWWFARITDDPEEARRRAERLGAHLRSDRVLTWVSRLSVVTLGLLALGVALGEVRAVFWFVLFAWSGLGAAFGPPVILSLYWSRTSWAGCLSGMVTGVVVTVWWKLSLKEMVANATGLSLYELVPAFGLSMLVTWLVSLAVPDTAEEERVAAALIESGEDA